MDLDQTFVSYFLFIYREISKYMILWLLDAYYLTVYLAKLVKHIDFKEVKLNLKISFQIHYMPLKCLKSDFWLSQSDKINRIAESFDFYIAGCVQC